MDEKWLIYKGTTVLACFCNASIFLCAPNQLFHALEKLPDEMESALLSYVQITQSSALGLITDFYRPVRVIIIL